jgi:hypothetical protein
MEELSLAHGDGRFAKLMVGDAKTDDLLILDDRYGNCSTLVSSQMPVDKWHALIGDLHENIHLVGRFIVEDGNFRRCDDPARHHPADRADYWQDLNHGA